MNLTKTNNVDMSTEILDMAEVLVTTERSMRAQEISANQLNVDAKKIETMPIADVTEVIGLQADVFKGLQ